MLFNDNVIQRQLLLMCEFRVLWDSDRHFLPHPQISFAVIFLRIGNQPESPTLINSVYLA